jgi:amino acid adenylation domain-containing protein
VIEDVYRLSPLQEGMLFESLYAPEADAYVIQIVWTLGGDLDPAALRRAWEELVRRHAVLRTSFHWQEMERPHQVVHGEVELPWIEEDWRGVPAAERERRLEEDRRAGFDLETAPLFRLRLLRLEDGVWSHVWTQHHLLLDGWSISRILQELFVAYAACRRGARPELPPARPFREYVEWLLRRDPAEAEAFWRRELEGYAAPALLGGSPALRHDFGGRGRLDAGLDPGSTAALQELAKRRRLTLNTFVQGAWALLLARRSGEEDVAFGVVVSGRSAAELPGIETAVGPFINTIPLRARLAPDERLLPWLAAILERQLEARRFEHSPLVEVQGWSGVPRDRPLFESLLAFEGSLLDPSLEGGAEGVRVLDARANHVSRAPVTFVAVPEGDRLRLTLSWDRGRFEPAEPRRWMGHLLTLLRGMAEDPDRTLADLSLLTEAERHQLAVEWNDTAVALPSGLTLHGLFLAQAERAPEAVAVVSHDGETVTYGELAERSARLARQLRGRGVGPEVRVGVSLRRSPRQIEAILAVLQAGGAYVPLDPDDPPERRDWIAADCGAALVLNEDEVHPPTVKTPRGASPPEQEAAAAYILYTSGTTGRPKGAMTTHRAAVNHILWAQSAFPLGPEDGGLVKAPLGFDASVREIFWPLAVGARLVVTKPGGERDPDHLIEMIQREGAAVVSLVPSLLAAVLDRETAPTRLRRITAGGEVLTAELADRCRERLPGTSLSNHYGPTETAVNATAWEVRPGDRSIPIGRPLANVRIDVLDPWGDPVPIGAAGEVCVGGTGVGRGYVGRPDLTAERFVPDPSALGARRYRTGDLARWRPDGALEFLGRVDLQVKLRGIRVEPEEVEAALAACPGVRQAAVLARDGALVAYVLPEVQDPGLPAALRAALGARLPAFLVPSLIVLVESFPRTPSGKIDRRALSRLEVQVPAEAFEAPRTPVEEQVAEVWSEVLKRPRVGIHDDFFALGGHSILALQVATRLREAFGVEVPLRRIFEASTLADLAREVELALRTGSGPVPPPLVPMSRDREIPLTFSQESLWFLYQLDPASPAYNVPATALVSGRLDPIALAGTLTEIVRRHEALRTTFRMAGGRPVQEIHPPAPVPLPVIDLTGRPEEARRFSQEEALRPFDLTRGPLLRARLVRLAEEEHLFLLTMHHAVSDEWSVAVLMREVGAIYTGIELPELPVQVADYAVWQREWLRGEVLEARLGWWKERLAGAPPVIDLPLDRPRTAARTFRGGRVPFEVPAEGLRRLARERSASLFMVLLAGFEAWLSRHGAGDDFVVGVPVANRSHPGTEGLIGFFVNTLPLRADLSGDPGFGELIERTRETALGAFARQDLPFERLVQELRPERSLAYAPLFQVMFSLHNVPMPGLKLPGLAFRPWETDPGTAKFDLLLEMSEAAGLQGSLEHASDLFDRTTAERLAGHLRVLLEAAAENPDLPLSELPLLTPAERRQIVEWSGQKASFPVACLHHLFEAQVRPEAIAVDRMTYAELDRRANGLARHLRRLGVGPETRVALRHDRTPGLIVGILGILKAGGAYVPIDPAWPEERARLILEDAGVSITVDEELLAACPESGEPLDVPVSPDNLAYVIYTSGSTGRPKGALVTHANVSRLLAATEPWFGFAPDDVWTLFHSAAFDFSVWEIWGALAFGGRLVIVPADTARSPEDFRLLLEGVTVLNQTPSAFRQLTFPPPTSLRWVIFGGEALDVGSTAAWLDGPRLVNMYGITETTVHVTFRPLAREDLEAPWRSPIGVPIPDLSLHVLRDGEPAPIGVPGELCVGGAGVARGYLNRPDLTAERFVPAPGGERLYRSGDLARRLPSGELEYLGRIDQQVKLRGFRIEPAEIEAALTGIPGVREAAVILRDDLPTGPGLVAYVVGAVAAGELLAILRKRLPDHMVPGHFVFLPALPLTGNGKLDRRALPAPEGARPDLQRAYVAPRTPLERVLAGAWEEALGVDRVGVEDGFFDLGGHSLLATQMISWVRETFEIEVPLRELFEHPTVAALAEVLARSPGAARTAELLLEMSELSDEEVAAR